MSCTVVEGQGGAGTRLYTLLIDECQCGIGRDQFAKKLFELKIGSGIHFTGIHLQPYYQRRFGYRADDFPNSTWISKRTVSLPFSASLTEADVDDVIAAIKYIDRRHQAKTPRSELAGTLTYTSHAAAKLGLDPRPDRQFLANLFRCVLGDPTSVKYLVRVIAGQPRRIRPRRRS